MKTLPLVCTFVSIALAAAACGGKSKGSAGPPPTGGSAAGPAPGDDAATPFDDGAVQAALARAPGVAGCGLDASTTMGAHFAAQRAALVGGGDGGNAVDESFACRAQDDGMWECQWAVFTKPSAPDPCDPCAEGGGSGYIIIATVGDGGALTPDKIYCNAPG